MDYLIGLDEAKEIDLDDWRYIARRLKGLYPPMDAPLEEFDEQAMKERVAQIIENAYKGRIAFAKAMSRPGITFSESQKAEINALVEAGDTEGAQRIILDVLTEAIGDGSKEGE